MGRSIIVKRTLQAVAVLIGLLGLLSVCFGLMMVVDIFGEPDRLVDILGTHRFF